MNTRETGVQPRVVRHDRKKKLWAVQSGELLRQNLAIEPDLQGFIDFALESVRRLGGNPFVATTGALKALAMLRAAGAGTGYPLTAALMLDGRQLLIRWQESGGTAAETASEPSWSKQCAHIASFLGAPSAESMAKLRQHLLNSTEATDPAILLQRNAEMARHLEETRARTEKELNALQEMLDARQKELSRSLHAAETDSLTGLLNRRSFDEKIDAAFRRTMRQRNEPLSLVLLDLDYFKQINDQFGHQVGDAHLVRMARTMQGTIRQDVDYAFRFGGDEFALLIFADYPLACEKARQVLESMDNKVSIGVTAVNRFAPEDLTLEQFIHHADNALYEAKRNGRGQVVVYPCPAQQQGDCGTPCPRMEAVGG